MMTPRPIRISAEQLNEFVEAYEAALERDGEADLADFLPPPAHALHLPVLRELICIDLERAQATGRRRQLKDYEHDFPRIFLDLNTLQAVTYEEYRLRLQSGEAVEPMEYARRFGVDVATWPRDDAEWQRLSQGEPVGDAERDRSRDTPTDIQSITPHAHLFARVRALSIEALEKAEQPRPANPPSARVDTASSGRCNPDVFAALYQDDPRAAFSFAEAATRLPEVGGRLLGFQLLEELGRGAFARVYLARQGELADRPVVLKVSADVGRESRVLAQLQHTNIVPVYSVHRTGALEAVCMPYFGVTTLADLLRCFQARTPTHGRCLVTTLRDCQTAARGLRSGRIATDSSPGTSAPAASPTAEPSTRPTSPRIADGSGVVLKMLQGMSYVQAVLWFGARLADGLAHAHARGVVHRDLKPANVLITDEGQPMLLDFNLAEDTKVSVSPTAAMIGGTLPYMSPEQLQAYRDRKRLIDPRTDIYSLGVILSEMLAGRHPFPLREGDSARVLPEMIADRQTAPRLPEDRCATPALQAIIRRCLAFDVRRRYQAAADLREDLERQLAHLPLKHIPEPSLRERFSKWRRRHPRLTSVTAAMVLAGLFLVAGSTAYAAVSARLARHEARAALQHLRSRAADVQFLLNPRKDHERYYERGLELGRQLLAEWQADGSGDPFTVDAYSNLSSLDQDQLRTELGELLLLCTRARIVLARADAGGLAEALRWNDQALLCYVEGQAPRALLQQRAELLDLVGRMEESKALRVQADALPLRSAEDCFLEGRELLQSGRPLAAVPLLVKATRRDPQHFWAWFQLGLCHEASGQDERACACFDVCAALRPDFHGVYFNRGLSHLKLRDSKRAAEDFDRALVLGEHEGDLKFDRADAHCNRGLARQGLGRLAEAVQDFTRALELDSSHTRFWFTRAQARERLGDTQGAADDRAEGLRREPRDTPSWVARALARKAKDPKGALADLDQALRLNPRSTLALQNKAALLAQEMGRTADAISVLDSWFKQEEDNALVRAQRGVLHGRLGQRAAAHADADEALRRSSDPPVLFEAGLIYAQTSKSHPEDCTEACRLLGQALRRGYGFELLASDQDLAPVRETAEFKRLVEGAKALQK